MQVFHISTPLQESPPLSALLTKNLGVPVEVYLKLENVQPSGSFKIRGIGNLCSKEILELKKTKIVSSSGGNAGLAAAYCAKKLNVPATIVLPSATPASVGDKLRSYGATVMVHGNMWAEADELARTIVAESPDTTAYVHPFDGKLIVEGNSTIVDEMHQALPEPDLIICSIGGGGLISGIELGLRRVGWLNVPMLVVETHGAHSFSAAKIAGKPVRLDAILSLATTLGAAQISDDAFRLTTHPKVYSCLVTDKEAVSACVEFANDHRYLVEPSCGAALASIYSAAPAVREALGMPAVNAVAQSGESKTEARSPAVAETSDSPAAGGSVPEPVVPVPEAERRPLRVVLVVCGGNGISIPILDQFKARVGL